jgi:hypothetical protein
VDAQAADGHLAVLDPGDLRQRGRHGANSTPPAAP